MTGLDPVIQPQMRSLDDRVKPGHDGGECVSNITNLS
jgi:hypothetical protein